MKLILILFIIYIASKTLLNSSILNTIYKIQWYLRLFLIIIPIIVFFYFPDYFIKFKDSFRKMESVCNSKFGIINILDLILNFDKKTNIRNNFKVNRNVSESKKKYIASNQKWKCKSCNNLLDATYEIDHKIPLYKGGTNDVNNLEALCRNCHGKKTLNDRLFD